VAPVPSAAARGEKCREPSSLLLMIDSVWLNDQRLERLLMR
jgi:hypothetical protein